MRGREAKQWRAERARAKGENIAEPGRNVNFLLDLQGKAGNRAIASALQNAVVQRQAVQRDNELDGGTEAEALQSGRSHPRTQQEARALVDAHVVPRDCFIELESSRAGWRPIPGTGCAHWVAHQRGGPTGTSRVCQDGFKYRVSDLLATLTQRSSDLRAAQVGNVWSANGSSHVGIVRAVTAGDGGAGVVSVEVENDSSASGGVVTQTKTDGSIYA